jgi:uncharacterized RDD family membrane protein YckC
VKCPKCGYLGFEEVPRCRNCGYDFAVGGTAPVPELPLRNPAASLDELPDLDLSGPLPADLPLFRGGDAAVEAFFPAGHVPPPRPPLAVRRATPEVARVRADTPPPRSTMLDLVGPEPLRDDPPRASGTRDAGRDAASLASPDPESLRPAPRALGHPILLEENEPAAFGMRALAAGIDLAVLGAIDAIVIYFTLKICGLGLEDLWRLPKAPLLAFLILQNGAYFAAFTAGGQTLGKMSAGIRVVSVDGPALDLPRALTRTALWALLAIPVGLGFLTALFDADRRGLHDRLTGTRVVRAGAA